MDRRARGLKKKQATKYDPLILYVRMMNRIDIYNTRKACAACFRGHRFCCLGRSRLPIPRSMTCGEGEREAPKGDRSSRTTVGAVGCERDEGKRETFIRQWEERQENRDGWGMFCPSGQVTRSTMLSKVRRSASKLKAQAIKVKVAVTESIEFV
jgi:hypothetical protein